MAGLIESYVYVGIKGHVLALDIATGTERWRTKLKGSDFVHVVSDGYRLLAAVRGEIFCLDGATGAVLWNNRLPGMGMGLAVARSLVDNHGGSIHAANQPGGGAVVTISLPGLSAART